MKNNATLYVDAIARGGRASSCPCGGGEGWAIVVVDVTGPLDGNACVAGPTTETAAQAGSQALFALVANLPPAKVPGNVPNNQANHGAYHWTYVLCFHHF
jgi:hypothetical protein